MRECIRCKTMSPIEDMEQMSGVIYLHNDLELCGSLKTLKESV